MAKNWSADLEKHYAVRLPPDIKAWFDGEVYKQQSGGEYNQPELPEELLDPSSPAVWAGQMLPDTIPLMGNGGGDVICGRVTPDGRICEIVAWNHEGGFWSPYGDSWAEALLYSVTPADGEAAEIHDEPGPKGILGKLIMGIGKRALRDPHRYRYAAWAMQYVPTLSETAVEELFALETRTGEILHQHRLFAVQRLRDRCREASKCRIADMFRDEKVRQEYQKLAQEAGRELSVSWSFDPLCIPDKYRGRVESITGKTIAELCAPDWKKAETAALETIALRQDLIWPYSVAGWAAERDGRMQEAIALYYQGAGILGSSSDFTEYWRTRIRYRLKFPLERLVTLRDQLPPELQSDPLIAAGAEWRISDYWMERAVEAEKCSDWQNAYIYLYRTGWDTLITDYSEEVLDRLAEAASHFSPSLAAVARHHCASRKR